RRFGSTTRGTAKKSRTAFCKQTIGLICELDHRLQEPDGNQKITPFLPDHFEFSNVLGAATGEHSRWIAPGKFRDVCCKISCFELNLLLRSRHANTKDFFLPRLQRRSVRFQAKRNQRHFETRRLLFSAADSDLFFASRRIERRQNSQRVWRRSKHK